MTDNTERFVSRIAEDLAEAQERYNTAVALFASKAAVNFNNAIEWNASDVIVAQARLEIASEIGDVTVDALRSWQRRFVSELQCRVRGESKSTSQLSNVVSDVNHQTRCKFYSELASANL